MLKYRGQTEDLVNELRRLPSQSPPAGAWRRIRRRAEREGLLEPTPGRFSRHRVGWFAGFAIAASLLLSVWITERYTPGNEVAEFGSTPSANNAALDALMRQSRLLEAALNLSPPPPHVVGVGRASREAAIEDRIAAIDQTLLLNARGLESRELAALWGERTAMMSGLIALRHTNAAETTL